MVIKSYEPKNPVLKDVRRRISEINWIKRVEDARRREKIVETILERMKMGESQNTAIAASVEESKRGVTLRNLAAYRSEGFEGLIDQRSPREPEIPIWIHDSIEIARMANPNITVQQVEEILQKKYRYCPSSTSIKRIIKEAGLQRDVGRPTKASDENTSPKGAIKPLEAAGYSMVFAAESETGAVGELVDTALEVAGELPEGKEVSSEERALRNPRGEFTGQFNQARRKGPQEIIATTHRTAAEKAEERDLGRLSFIDQSRETIEQKVWALISLPAIPTLKGRLEELRGPHGRLLEEFCGYGYQVETLRKVVSEFTLSGLAERLQKQQAESWHRVSVERWETEFQAAVVYIDNNIKPLWTSFFTKSAKVSSTGRVQPALSSTFINTGAGVPIYFETHSGSAPLAPRVLDLLREVEAETEESVGRLTVIDGECCSASLLKAFKEEGRDLVVPLSASMVQPERFEFGPGSSFRPYRQRDMIREGSITLVDSKDKNVTVVARAIIIERGNKDKRTVLVTLAESDEWGIRELADAYFGRWPKQEGFFRSANQSINLKRVHGYGKRVVINTAVLEKLEELTSRIERCEDKQEEEIARLREVGEKLNETKKELNRIVRYRAKREERVDAALEQGSTHTQDFAIASAELRESTQEERKIVSRVESLEEQRDKLESKTQRREARIEKMEQDREKLDGRKEIVEADVAQDTLFTTMKLTLAMLIRFVIVEYFSDCPMEWTTFLSRIAQLPGHRETTEENVTYVIYGNHRDVKLMKALNEACRRINERNLDYKGKRLRYKLHWPDGVPDKWII